MDDSATIAGQLAEGIRRLAAIDSARLDAEVLLAHVLQTGRSTLFAWPERPVTDAQQRRYRELLTHRANHVPVAYLTGTREFWSLPLTVNEHTLIPRPETELLVDTLLARLATDSRARIADLGTGSGAIAIALATARPAVRLVATDLSADALAAARNNAATLAVTNIEFRHGDWYKALHGDRFDYVVSNPPYIASGDPHLQQGDVRHEPRSALIAGPDGLDDLKRIIAGAGAWLADGGQLLLEHGHDQARAVRRLLADSGFNGIGTRPDLAGLDRMTSARWSR